MPFRTKKECLCAWRLHARAPHLMRVCTGVAWGLAPGDSRMGRCARVPAGLRLAVQRQPRSLSRAGQRHRAPRGHVQGMQDARLPLASDFIPRSAGRPRRLSELTLEEALSGGCPPRWRSGPLVTRGSFECVRVCGSQLPGLLWEEELLG